MLILLTVLLFTFSIGPARKTDPQQEYYCKIVCRNNYEFTSERHVACYCNKHNNPQNCTPYQPNEVFTFRQAILHEHNEKRNDVASGKEINKNLGNASNMNVINYDLELEYVAMCTAMKCENKRDYCRKTEKFNDVRQNMFQMEVKNFKLQHMAHFAVKQWYAEKKITPRFVIDDYWYAEAWSHVTAMLWWSVTHIGCAITSGYIGGNFSVTVICNYGIMNEDMSNKKTIPVYIRGKPATACFTGSKKNSKFTALCGDLHDIPKGLNSIHPAYREQEPTSASGLSSCNFIVILFHVIAVFL